MVKKERKISWCSKIYKWEKKKGKERMGYWEYTKTLFLTHSISLERYSIR